MEKSDQKETIINCVQKLRSERDMTQQQLADVVGVTRQTVIAIEKGNYIPSVLLALRIACYFGVALEKIFSIGCETSDVKSACVEQKGV